MVLHFLRLVNIPRKCFRKSLWRVCIWIYWTEWRWLNFILSWLYILEKLLYAVWYKCETSSSQTCISQYCRPCTFYLLLDREMLRWNLTASKLTAFNQSLADLRGPLLILCTRIEWSSMISSLCKVVLSSFSNIYNLWLLILVVVTLTFFFSNSSKLWTNFIFL